jgi:chaperonin GroEL
MGYNAKDDDYSDLMANGIIDPTKVERVSLENAVSNASVFITTHAVIVDYKEEKK